MELSNNRGAMEDHNEKYNNLIGRFVEWGNQSDDIRAAIIIGSRARITEPADQWADLDIIIFSRNIEKYLFTTEWLIHMGSYWITFIEDDALGMTKERRVLYDGALDVDYVFYPENESKNILENPETKQVMQKGFKVIIDKDNKFRNLNQIQDDDKEAGFHISKEELLNLINDFWFHAVRATKKLLRGELFIAKSNVDEYMKQNLLKLIEIHAKVENGPNYDTWHNGRYIEKWADPRIIDGLKKTFSHYNKKDIEQGLWETMNLYRWIAKNVCNNLNITYPSIADEKATEWINQQLK